MDVRSAVDRLTEGIGQRAPEIERARRLPADLAADLAAAGVFRMLVPTAIGGLEFDVLSALDVIERVARADASTGWCVMIGATAALPAAYMEPTAAREIFTPDAIVGGVFAPMGRAVSEGDGYRLSGRWAWGSGSANARWLSGGAVILEDGKPRLLPGGVPQARMMFFPADAARLHDTWHVSGLQGTGSGDFEVDGIHIPRTRSVSLTVDRPWAEGPLYRFPLFGLLALGISAVALGNARAAMSDLIALATHKTPQGGRRTLAERTTVQAAVADQEARLSASRAFVREAVSAAWAMAERGDPLDLATRARLRLAATHATRASADVVRVIYDLGGGSSVFASSPLQRRFRDAHVATQHMMIAPATYELLGRALLGLPMDDAMV